MQARREENMADGIEHNTVLVKSDFLESENPVKDKTKIQYINPNNATLYLIPAAPSAALCLPFLELKHEFDPEEVGSISMRT